MNFKKYALLNAYYLIYGFIILTAFSLLSTFLYFIFDVIDLAYIDVTQSLTEIIKNSWIFLIINMIISVVGWYFLSSGFFNFTYKILNNMKIDGFKSLITIPFKNIKTNIGITFTTFFLIIFIDLLSIIGLTQVSLWIYSVIESLNLNKIPSIIIFYSSLTLYLIILSLIIGFILLLSLSITQYQSFSKGFSMLFNQFGSKKLGFRFLLKQSSIIFGFFVLLTISSLQNLDILSYFLTFLILFKFILLPLFYQYFLNNLQKR